MEGIDLNRARYIPIAPYFPFIQSTSGMGKTKVMHEYPRKHKNHAKKILSGNAKLQNRKESREVNSIYD